MFLFVARNFKEETPVVMLLLYMISPPSLTVCMGGGKKGRGGLKRGMEVREDGGRVGEGSGRVKGIERRRLWKMLRPHLEYAVPFYFLFFSVFFSCNLFT